MMDALKFVDLVRNYTTTIGAGPIYLGAPVGGFEDFSKAVAVGERFYYCISGIDKPQEREVGQGTMLGDGCIGREPITGAPTDFSPGLKTIALVTAAP